MSTTTAQIYILKSTSFGLSEQQPQTHKMELLYYCSDNEICLIAEKSFKLFYNHETEYMF